MLFPYSAKVSRSLRNQFRLRFGRSTRSSRSLWGNPRSASPRASSHCYVPSSVLRPSIRDRLVKHRKLNLATSSPSRVTWSIPSCSQTLLSITQHVKPAAAPFPTKYAAPLFSQLHSTTRSNRSEKVGISFLLAHRGTKHSLFIHAPQPSHPNSSPGLIAVRCPKPTNPEHHLNPPFDSTVKQTPST